MFGYVRPNRDELKVRQLRDYEALYCRLCAMVLQRNLFPVSRGSLSSVPH